MELKDFLKLAGKQGKVVVLGEDGAVKGVFLPIAEYQRLAGTEQGREEQSKQDIAEKVNREILQAQLEEVISPLDAAISHNSPESVESPEITDTSLLGSNPMIPMSNAERLDSLLSRRAQTLFKSVPYNSIPPEVTTTAADEEIKPNFDDI
jgi:hypothetical protein